MKVHASGNTYANPRKCRRVRASEKRGLEMLAGCYNPKGTVTR